MRKSPTLYLLKSKQPEQIPRLGGFIIRRFRVSGFLIRNFPVHVYHTSLFGLKIRLNGDENYFTLMGLIAGSNTDPPALAYSNQASGNDAPSVGYSTVYPLTMFLRILAGQMILLTMM